MEESNLMVIIAANGLRNITDKTQKKNHNFLAKLKNFIITPASYPHLHFLTKINLHWNNSECFCFTNVDFGL